VVRFGSGKAAIPSCRPGTLSPSSISSSAREKAILKAGRQVKDAGGIRDKCPVAHCPSVSPLLESGAQAEKTGCSCQTAADEDPDGSDLQSFLLLRFSAKTTFSKDVLGKPSTLQGYQPTVAYK
jgi:hypothetical protein